MSRVSYTRTRVEYTNYGYGFTIYVSTLPVRARNARGEGVRKESPIVRIIVDLLGAAFAQSAVVAKVKIPHLVGIGF